MLENLKYKKRSLTRDLLVFSIIIVILVGSFFLFSNYKKNNFVIASENLGGWSWNNFFGWTSESCNNLYDISRAIGYEDHCGLDIPRFLDIGFDGNDISFDGSNIMVRDNGGEGTINRVLSNFEISDIRNGARDENGTPLKNSNFNNSLYFNGVNNYIEIDEIDPGINNADQLTITWWAKAPAKTDGIEEGLFRFIHGQQLLGISIVDEALHWSLSGEGNVVIFDDVFVWGDDLWHYYTLVKDGDSYDIYRDSLHLNHTSLNAQTGSFIEIGRIGDNYFEGELDDIRIFGSILTENQIIRNSFYNSTYLLDIENLTGDISGWVWSSGIGWICFGETCDGPAPDDSDPESKLHWSVEEGEDDIYPHMITGWANAVTFNNTGREEDNNTGWMSLQGDIVDNDYDEYRDCVSCSFRDEELDLVAYLKFDENDGYIASDSSGEDNYGALVNFTDPSSSWRDEGVFDSNCLYFNGEDNYILMNNTESLNFHKSSFTIEFWAKSPDWAALNYEYLFDFENAWRIIVLGDGQGGNQIRFSTNFPWCGSYEWDHDSDTMTFDNDTWYHFAYVFNKDVGSKWYINEIGNTNFTIAEPIYFCADWWLLNDFINYSPTSSIGSNSGSSGYFNGSIDNFKIYKRALSSDELENNYKNISQKFCSACLTQVLGEEINNNICYECVTCNESEEVMNCEACSSCRQYGLVFDTNTASIKGYAWGGYNSGGLGWFKFSPNFGVGLYRPYVSTRYGNIYSKADIGSDSTVVPPAGYFNSTYMIQANGHIINWVSDLYESNDAWIISADTGNSSNYEYPRLENDYGNLLGNLDYVGLVNERYGEVVNNFPNSGGASEICLDNKIYKITGNAILEEKADGTVYNFLNGPHATCPTGGAAGTIIIDGDLIITGDIKYDNVTFISNSDNLASVAWIVKGDLKIAPEVTRLSGSFIVLGIDGIECGSDLENPIAHCGSIYTCYDGSEGECINKLEVSGQFLAKNFRFQRTFRSSGDNREPAEEIIYDGRNIINPPPGLGDVLKSLPTWTQIAPY